MTRVRIIPRLDIKGPNLVKGVHLEGLRVLGKPERFAQLYYATGADELLYMDVVASLFGRNSLLDVVQRTASNTLIPLAVGGGIRTLGDIQAVLRAGADKVAINTAAIARPAFIREAADMFGSSTVVVSIEAIRQPNGTYLAFTDNGREHTGRDVTSWAQEAASLGAGELLLTSVDREGTGSGFDLELTRVVSDAVSIPVIASGGAGTPEHVAAAVIEGRADAVGLASMLHYEAVRALHTDDPKDFLDEGNVEFLRRAVLPSRKIRPSTLRDVKAALAEQGVQTRPLPGQRVGAS